MDELKIKSKFMKSLIAKIIEKAVRQKLDTDLNLLIDDFDFSINEGRLKLHMNLDVETDANVLLKVLG